MYATTILQVEDDENDVFFFQRAMNKAGLAHLLQVAHDGQEAIDYLQGLGKFAKREKFPLPGLILLDLKLPFVMGLDVLKWIRQQPELTCVVIILSSSREEGDVAEAYRSGANAYLVKPADVSKLEGLVRAINDFWLMQNTPPPMCLAGPGLNISANPRAQGLSSYGRPTVTRSLARAPSKISGSDL
jgi:CheY-like chemotaxis protein